MRERLAIIGDGDIAGAIELEERDTKLYFASGVSNSQETREIEYQRERDLLLGQDRSRHIVYFSSLCVFYLNTRYARHKREMERVVKDKFNHYTIMRIGNITWGNNPNTIINYFKRQKAEGKPLEIQDAYRYVTDAEEFHHWMKMIPTWNAEMNVPGRRMSIREIVEEFV